MREFFVVCILVLSVAILDVKSNSIYRNGRDLKLIEGERKDELRGFRHEIPEPVQVDLVQPVLIFKEEVLVPVETLQNIEPVAEVDEPESIVVEDGVRRHEDDVAPSLNDGQNDHYSSSSDDGYTGGHQDEIIQEQEDQIVQLSPAPGVLKQGTSTTTGRPSLIQQAQQIISNNPFGQFIDSIRGTSTRAPEGEQSGVESTTNGNIFQQIQAGVQNIGSQITSAFTPPGQNNLQAAESNPSQTVVRPPNFFEQLQTNFQNTVQGIFRPNTDPSVTGGAQPQGPFQAVLSNVQNFLNGNRGEASAAQTSASDTPQKVEIPVDDKLDYTKNSGEVQDENAAESSKPSVAAQPAEVAKPSKLDQEDAAVVLVDKESSLENESE